MMSDAGSLLGFLGVLVSSLPGYLAYLIAGGVAVMKWKKNPKPAKIVLGVAVASLAVRFFSQIYHALILPQLYDRIGYEVAGYIIGVIGFLQSCLWALLFLAMVWAAFADRPGIESEFE